MSAHADLDPQRALTVLLVDDEAAMLRLYAVMLKHAGYRVLATESALDAIALLALEAPDLILLDYMLPIMDAPMFLREIRRDRRLADVPVIVLTASDAEAHIEAAFAAGGDDYITKPIDRRILLARVKATIEAHAARRQATQADAIAHERDALQREVDDARLLQGGQLPEFPMRWGGWALHGALVPFGCIGGDIFDVITESEDERTITLVDVSGHGLAAAMVASSVRSCLHLLHAGGPREMVAGLNQHLCQRGNLYACVTVLRVTPEHVSVVSAGLPPVAVIERGVVTQLIGPTGTPPGLLVDAEYDVVRIKRTPGIRFVILSDGLTEPFGLADDTPSAVERLGLLEDLGQRDLPAESRIRALFPDGDAQPDDATLVVLCDERSTDEQTIAAE